MVTKRTLDISSYSIELHLLIILIAEKPQLTNIEEIRRQQDKINWTYFVKIVEHHRVYSLVYMNAKKWGIDWIPEKTMSYFQKKYTMNTFQMLKLSAETNLIWGNFEQNEIPALFLKGPLLGDILYNDVSLRTSKDLDLLIPLDRIAEAEKILGQLGYVCSDNKPRILNDWKWRDHHISYFNPSKGIQVELHWRLSPGFSKEPSFQKLWERRQMRTISNSIVPTLGYDDLFCYLITHGSRHGWFRLRWLVDIDRFLKSGLIGNISDLINAHNGAAATGQTFILCKTLFATKINQELLFYMSGKKNDKLAQMSSDFIQEAENLSPVPLTKKLKKDFRKYTFSLNTPLEKLISLLSHLIPSSYDAQQLPLPKYLHFLYVVLRPILWIVRKRKRQTVSLS